MIIGNPKGIGRTKIGSPSTIAKIPQNNRIQLGILFNRQQNRIERNFFINNPGLFI
jgi:hypothetical protein